MNRAIAICLRAAQPALFAACLGIWGAIALEAAGVISLAPCTGPACANPAADQTARKHF